jgi:hypothetical protein
MSCLLKAVCQIRTRIDKPNIYFYKNLQQSVFQVNKIKGRKISEGIQIINVDLFNT